MTVEISKDGNNVIITAPINKNFPSSKSGKTRIVTTSNGNINTGTEIDTPDGKKNLTVGYNVYFK